MSWEVKFSKRAEKQVGLLPQKAQFALRLLVKDLQTKGPATEMWPNYGKLKGLGGDKRHCHLLKGRPTYVCCWEVLDKQLKLIEVYYVGSHEKAPY